MKVTVYTIKDCAFSKQEKEYLNANKLGYVEKDLETNKDFLTEMLAVSNNFAGTPVTRVEKDDGTIAVLKGFTKEEFDTTFGLTPIPTTNSDVQTPNLGVSTNEPPPAETIPPAPIPTPPVEVTVPEPNNQAINDPLKSVMDDLQSKSQTTDQSLPPTPPVPLTDANPPVVNPTAPAPAIPDFPAK